MQRARRFVSTVWCRSEMAHRKTSGFTWALDPGREALQKAGQLDFKTAAVRSASPLLRHLALGLPPAHPLLGGARGAGVLEGPAGVGGGERAGVDELQKVQHVQGRQDHALADAARPVGHDGAAEDAGPGAQPARRRASRAAAAARPPAPDSRCCAQEYGFFTQQQKRFVPANG